MLIIYGKTPCSYCVLAKKYCEDNNISYLYKELNADYTKEFLLETFSSAKTFPVIEIDGEYIGGYSELKERKFTL